MKTLIIYDNTGYMFFQITGGYRKPEGGLNFLEIEIPEGKILKGVNTSVTPNVAILEDIPRTELELARERIDALEQSNAEMMNLITTTSTNV